ncbi:MAG TPA: hypothetical protein VKP88_05635 [Candidatus Paceibacterota bacterium]|nr:hypothetical protein [Candidatus Paceibacterota bacterium]
MWRESEPLEPLDVPESSDERRRMMRQHRIVVGVEAPRNAVVQAAKDSDLARALAAESTLPGCRRNLGE